MFKKMSKTREYFTAMRQFRLGGMCLFLSGGGRDMPCEDIGGMFRWLCVGHVRIGLALLAHDVLTFDE